MYYSEIKESGKSGNHQWISFHELAGNPVCTRMTLKEKQKEETKINLPNRFSTTSNPDLLFYYYYSKY